MSVLAQPPAAQAHRGLLARAWDSDIGYSFRTSPVAIGAAAITLVIVLATVFAEFITPQNPFDAAALNLMDGFTPPGEAGAGSGMYFGLGADSQGRDMYSAILYGSRVSLLIGTASVIFSLVLGVSLGLIAGYIGGRIEALIMRIADIQLSFPAILVALLVFGIARGLIHPSLHEQMTFAVMTIAIGLSNWAQYARTVRASTLVEKRKEYVDAARVIGLRAFPVMIKHVLPNVAGPILVIATINLALAVLEEATLSFLGVGMPPTQPSLGTLIRIGQQFLFSGEWWILLFPSLALVTIALSINLFGDWLRDALNPKLR
ncbi:ABC transporter permease [Bradyrhizobium sp. LHD-71]|uniref:ABC transporter permease n=1 Tax=Bradyrhizobium sp. LHD-71 TaxID=3072141 RepID=UPI00280CD9C0|nr:ABC transporter permease [Bradyrhizobium sp. LHD-71]MDQ8730972.1 ABC transporter permease [Bradyrhizobium sp. LHD-71]